MFRNGLDERSGGVLSWLNQPVRFRAAVKTWPRWPKDIFLPIRGPNRSRKHTSSHYFIISDWPFSKLYFSIIAKSNIQFMNYLALDDNCPIIKKRSRWFICLFYCYLISSLDSVVCKRSQKLVPEIHSIHILAGVTFEILDHRNILSG